MEDEAEEKEEEGLSIMTMMSRRFIIARIICWISGVIND